MLERGLEGLAAFRRGLLLAQRAWRLEVLPASRLGNQAVLLDSLREAAQERLKALTVLNSYLNQTNLPGKLAAR